MKLIFLAAEFSTRKPKCMQFSFCVTVLNRKSPLVLAGSKKKRILDTVERQRNKILPRERSLIFIKVFLKFKCLRCKSDKKNFILIELTKHLYAKLPYK